jgi:DinB superfamily
MADINTALDASKDAIEQLIMAGERRKTDWTWPRAPGKWSPSQIVEHVARSLEESANMASGRPSKFPKLPGVVHPIVRGHGQAAQGICVRLATRLPHSRCAPDVDRSR